MTPPCRLANGTIYRKTARHSARFYALRAASGADGSRPIPTTLPVKGLFDKLRDATMRPLRTNPLGCCNRKKEGSRPLPTLLTCDFRAAIWSRAGHAPPLPAARKAYPAPHQRYFRRVGTRTFISIGLAIWSFIPASSATCLSSEKAFAVMAMMGIFAFWASSSRRIFLAAS